MPVLGSMSLRTELAQPGAEFEIAFIAKGVPDMFDQDPEQDVKRDSLYCMCQSFHCFPFLTVTGFQDSPYPKLIWSRNTGQTGEWRPDEEVLRLWKEKSNGFLVRFLDY